MTDAPKRRGCVIVVELTDTQWELLGLYDKRVRDDYAAKGLHLSHWRATGSIEAVEFLRHHASCFEDAERASTRRSMSALILKIDRAITKEA